MIYTHVLNRGGLAVRSPLDAEERGVERQEDVGTKRTRGRYVSSS